MYKEHLEAEAMDSAELEKVADKAFARAKATKAECLIVKAFMNKSKDDEAKFKSFQKHKEELAVSARVDPVEWILPILLATGKDYESKKAGVAEKKTAAADGKKKEKKVKKG
jgi:hypothetical protein